MAKSSNPKKKAAPNKRGGRNRRAVPLETKAVVLGALLAGQGVDEVAAKYNIPVGTVKGWKSKLKGEAPAQLSPEQKADVSGLILEYLRENLITLIFQQRTQFRNPKWLLKQSASEMATLHGVAADKCARLMQAMSGPPPEGEEASPT